MSHKPLYKEYHRNYTSIDELYDDLRDALLHVSLKNGRIVIPYGKDIWQIEHRSGEYIIYLNGEKEKGSCEDQDIYFHALEFAHEQLCGGGKIEIDDIQIDSVNADGFTYTDTFDRRHQVNFADCAREFSVLHPRATRCVGERDITKYRFTLYTPGVKTVIRCERFWRFRRQRRLLTGSRSARFQRLQKLIRALGYSTFDLS